MILLALTVALPAMAQMGKWVDTEGRVHYGDQPPQTRVRQLPMSQGAVSVAHSDGLRSYANASRSSGGESRVSVIPDLTAKAATPVVRRSCNASR